MARTLKSDADITDVIGKTPPSVNLKVIDHIDAAARQWLTVSPVCFTSFHIDGSAGVTLGSGPPGFVSSDAKSIRIPLAALDQPQLAQVRSSFGSLFLAPGICETLRINGSVAAVDGEHVNIAVEECYLHCAKALIRSEFWEAKPINTAFDDAADFVNASRFMTLATFDAAGRADLSPKGDPANKLTRTRDRALWFADRPGNRRVDSFRNIITQDEVAALLLIPGSTQVVHFTGSALITTDETLRAEFEVKGKTPLISVQI
ncbi:MAG: pyridoxamine 5'-phosphate oxidase family protein, partial [Chloroflexota bacterium]